MLNVFVKQFDLVALLADFHSQQIAHREHADPTLPIDNREMSAADLLHPLKGLVRRLVTLDDRAQLAGDVTNFNHEGIAFCDYNAIHDVAL